MESVPMDGVCEDSTITIGSYENFKFKMINNYPHAPIQDYSTNAYCKEVYYKNLMLRLPSHHFIIRCQEIIMEIDRRLYGSLDIFNNDKSLLIWHSEIMECYKSTLQGLSMNILNKEISDLRKMGDKSIYSLTAEKEYIGFIDAIEYYDEIITKYETYYGIKYISDYTLRLKGQEIDIKKLLAIRDKIKNI